MVADMLTVIIGEASGESMRCVKDGCFAVSVKRCQTKKSAVILQ